jgi:hypothetical protein
MLQQYKTIWDAALDEEFDGIASLPAWEPKLNFGH